MTTKKRFSIKSILYRFFRAKFGLEPHDAIGAHARDELGISETLRARPIQAALASASSFAVGAAMPLIVTAAAPEASLIIFVGNRGKTPGVGTHWSFLPTGQPWVGPRV